MLLKIFYEERVLIVWDFPGGSEGKASVYSAGDLGSIPGLEDSLEREMAIHYSTLAQNIPWTEESSVHGGRKVGPD